MSTIGERIAQVIEEEKVKKVQFAEKIGVDQSYISQLVSGKRTPSDRTIRDICKAYNVREPWLKDGIEPMRTDDADGQELSDIWAEIEKTDDVLIKAIVKAYWKLDEKDKAAVRKLVDRFVEEMNKKKSPGG